MQCKAEHAKNTLHEELAKQWEEEMQMQATNPSENIDNDFKNDNNANPPQT